MKITEIQIQAGDKKQKYAKLYFFAGNLPSQTLKVKKQRVGKPLVEPLLEKLKTSNPEVYDLLKDAKFKWSKYCGCTCGCSPGLVSNVVKNMDIFVTFRF